MRKISFAFLLTLFFSMVGNNAFAYDAEVDGIYYNFKGNEAIVTCYSSTSTYRYNKDGYNGDVVIPEKVTHNGKTYDVTSIESNAFYECSTLNSIKIPSSIASSGSLAFEGCNELTKVIIDNLSSWCKISFQGNPNSNPLYYAKHLYYSDDTEITELVIPEDITTIGDYSFCGGSYITSVSLHNNVTSIGFQAFAYCNHLKSINIPSSINSIEWYAFEGCNYLEKVIISDLSSWCKIPFDNVIKTSNPLFFSHRLFIDDNTEITELVIPDDITKIGYNTFTGCTNITSVVVHENVKEIFASAFDGCTSLSKVTIKSQDVLSKQMLSAVFGEQVTDYIIDNGLTTIGGNVFSNCTNMSSITIPSSITTINIDAFKGCENLSKVVVNDLAAWYRISFGNALANPLFYAKHLYDNANKEITELVIPEDLSTINEFAFSGCVNISKISLNNNTIASAKYTKNANLGNCFGSGVKEIVLGDNITSLGECAFFNCQSLSSVSLPNTLTSIGAMTFSGCSSLSSITIPNSIVSIGNSAFYGCNGLSKVITNSLSSWLKIAFENETANPLFYARHLCNNNDQEITELVIPEDVTTINKFAFIGWESIKKVILNSNDIASAPYDKYSNLGNRFGGIKEIIIGDAVKSIGTYAFYSYGSRTNKGIITLGDNISSVSTLAFDNSNTMIYTKKGTKTVLALWKAGYDVYEINKYLIERPSLKKSSSTQTTLSLYLIGYYNEYTYTLNGKDYDGGNIKLTGLRPGANVYLGYLTISLDDVIYQQNYSNYFTTSSISPSVKKASSSASSLTLKGTYTKGDAEVSKMTITVNKTNIDGDSITITGLNPNTTYRATYTITVKYGDNLENTYDYTSISNIKTEALTLKTKQPKVVSLGNVIVSAEANVDDEEKNVGFEWRRTDWTDDFQSNTGTAIMVEGTMEGYIRNLNTEKLWKFRPYYLADNGTYYYGDWVGVDPTNTSFFEPTVHTYDKIVVNGNTALVKGYALGGSDDVTVQGFKYWKSAGGGSNRVSSADIPSDAKTVEASGTVMEVSLSDLDYDSSYSYVTFVTTSKGTYYGEIKTFETGKEPLILGDANGDMKVNVSDIVEIVNDILGKPSAKYNRNAADVNGDGQVNVTDIVNVVNIIMTSSSSASARRAASNNSLWLDGGTIRLRNAENYTATQFDINLSEGQSVGNIRLSSTSNHQLTWQMVDENTCRVVVYSLSNAPFHTTDDVLFNITLNGSATISNEMLIDADGSATAVERIQQDKPMDVYDLRGNKVRSNVTNLRGLAKGIYIINGKKVILQ